MVRYLIAAGLLVSGTLSGLADPTCTEQATAKKLAGAARNSFVTQCQKDATAACQKTSAEKKLSGAAKTSFETKCIKDAAGS